MFGAGAGRFTAALFTGVVRAGGRGTDKRCFFNLRALLRRTALVFVLAFGVRRRGPLWDLRGLNTPCLMAVALSWQNFFDTR